MDLHLHRVHFLVIIIIIIGADDVDSIIAHCSAMIAVATRQTCWEFVNNNLKL